MVPAVGNDDSNVHYKTDDIVYRSVTISRFSHVFRYFSWKVKSQTYEIIIKYNR